MVEGRIKRFRIKDSPGRAYSRPTAGEVSALQALVDAGRHDGTAFPAFERQSGFFKDLLAGHAAVAQQTGLVIQTGDNGRFNTDRAGIGLDHSINAAMQIRPDMIGFSRADMAGAVGGGSGDGASGFFDQRPGNRVGGQTQADAGKTRAIQITDRALLSPWHHKREGPGPEGVGQLAGHSIEAAFTHGLGQIRHMGDQRIELWSPFGSIKSGDGLRIGCICA